MAYDEGLAERLREALGAAGVADSVVEKKMFGGLALLVHGNMCVGVIGDDLIARVGPDLADTALSRPGARMFDFTGKPMKNWVMVAGEVLEDDVLAEWVADALAFVRTLPPK